MVLHRQKEIAEHIRSAQRLRKPRNKPSDLECRVMLIAGEVWKQIDGFALYDVSNFGRVRSYYRGRWGHRETPRILLPGKNRIDYRHVTLVRHQRNHTHLIHLLVARAFLGPMPEHHRLDHIDGDNSNNKLENLTYKLRGKK